jgi:hypothetical protein
MPLSRAQQDELARIKTEHKNSITRTAKVSKQVYDNDIDLCLDKLRELAEGHVVLVQAFGRQKAYLKPPQRQACELLLKLALMDHPKLASSMLAVSKAGVHEAESAAGLPQAKVRKELSSAEFMDEQRTVFHLSQISEENLSIALRSLGSMMLNEIDRTPWEQMKLITETEESYGRWKVTIVEKLTACLEKALEQAGKVDEDDKDYTGA